MQKEKTLVLLKPETLTRHLVGRILTRFEDAGLKIIAMKLVQADEAIAKQHYEEDIAIKHGERVRSGLIKYIIEGPVIAIVFEGINAIPIVRKMVGSTYPSESLPGTIRGDFAHVSKDYANHHEINVRNLVHASANQQDAEREIPIWFAPEEFYTYKTAHDYICLDED